MELAIAYELEAPCCRSSPSDIVIEAARPRALAQLGINAAAIVRATPGLVWITITGHGAEGDAAGWVGFGDDCGVAAGLSVALRAAGGTPGFVGDARCRRVLPDGGARGGPEGARDQLADWSAARGQPFPAVERRSIGPVRAFGADTRACLSAVAPC